MFPRPHHAPFLPRVAQMHKDKKGLFRLSGRASSIKMAWADLAAGVTVDWFGLCPHVVTGIVKLYLRSRSTSLLSAAVVDGLAAASATAGAQASDSAWLVKALPATDLAVAKTLFTVLAAVASSDAAAMDPKNLAIAIGVSMTPPGNGSMEEALSVKAKVVPMIAFVIKHHRALGLVEAYTPRCLVHTSTCKQTRC